MSNTELLNRISPLVRDFSVEIKDGEEKKVVEIYDHDPVMFRLKGMPEYAVEETLNYFGSTENQQGYTKTMLDKWGRKSPDTKKYAETPTIVFYRAALCAAQGMQDKDNSVDVEEKTKKIFYRFLNREIYPNTPFMANAGHKNFVNLLEQKLGEQQIPPAIREDFRQERKIEEQLFACFVLPIHDSLDSIFETQSVAAKIQAQTGGTGFNFSELRPANETVHRSGGVTDGPVSFMKMYSISLGETMNQAGKRDGANMFMLDYNHPDIMRFIYCKRKDGEIKAANISLAVDHEFMQAAMSEGDERFYKLKNPHSRPDRPHVKPYYHVSQLKQAQDIAKTNKKAILSLKLGDNEIDVLSPWLPGDIGEGYKTIGKVGKDGFIYLDAKKVLRHLVYGAWYNGEPGVIFTETINDKNPLHPKHYREWLLEQGDDLSRKKVEEISSQSRVIGSLEEIVDSHLLQRDENGVLVNLPIGVGEIRATNPCGEKPLPPYEACDLGHVNLEMVVESEESELSGYKVNWNKLKELSDTVYEILDNGIDQNKFTDPRIEATQKSNRKIGLGVMGLANMLYKLEIPYNSQKGLEFIDEVLGKLEQISDEASFAKAEKFGPFPNFKYSAHRKGRPKRNAIVRTIAPTGTTGFVARTTGGIEPEYALAYERTTVQGTKIKIFNTVLDEKLTKYNFFLGEDNRERLWNFIKNEGRGSLTDFRIERSMNESEESFDTRKRNLQKIKDIFVTTYDISPGDHVNMAVVVQNHIDDAVSKTTNFRDNATVGDIERTLIDAYQRGVKGLTFYRDGARKDQPLQVGSSAKEGKEELGISRRELSDLVIKAIEAPRPEDTPGRTVKVKTPFGKNIFVTLNYEEGSEGRVAYETFLSFGKTGRDLGTMAEGTGRVISLALKAGVPPEYIVEQLKGIEGETQEGFGKNKITSLPDAIAKGIEEILIQERGEKRNGVGKGGGKTGNFCPDCGSHIVEVEGCQKCFNNCGFSKC